jgi:hypothetical protein
MKWEKKESLSRFQYARSYFEMQKETANGIKFFSLHVPMAITLAIEIARKGFINFSSLFS